MAESARQPNGDRVFRFERRVEFADTDMAGIAHFSSLFRYMEEAEHAFLRSVGLSVFARTADAITWPRLSASCDFKSPARFEDVLTIAVTLAELGRKTATYAFQLSLEGREVAVGRIVVICCRIDAEGHLKAMTIDDETREKLLTIVATA